MTERETQPTADDKYTVHSIYDPHIHVRTVLIVVSIYMYMYSYTDSHVSH